MFGKKMGRPIKEIDADNFEKLCRIMCTKREIAAFFECSEDTIENFCKKTYNSTFSAIYQQKRDVGLISLRRKQYQVAESGNTSMLIWLGKQYLDQKDKQEVSPEENGFKVVIQDYTTKTE